MARVEELRREQGERPGGTGRRKEERKVNEMRRRRKTKKRHQRCPQTRTGKLTKRTFIDPVLCPTLSPPP